MTNIFKKLRLAHEATTDWIFVFLITTLSIVVLVFLAVSLYFDVDNTLSHKFVADPALLKPLINKDNLKSVVHRIEDRVKDREYLNKGMSISPDPSL